MAQSKGIQMLVVQGLFRDYKGNLLLRCQVTVLCNQSKAELLAIQTALSLAVQTGISNIELHSDSKVAITLLQHFGEPQILTHNLCLQVNVGPNSEIDLNAHVPGSQQDSI